MRRSSFVQVLAERPRDKHGLANDPGASWPTVDRVVHGLLDASLAKRAENRYRLACIGRCALGVCGECLDSSRGVHSARGLLSISSVDVPLGPAFLAGATVHTSTSDILSNAIQGLLSSVEDAE